jgi:hypothetical protein
MASLPKSLMDRELLQATLEGLKSQRLRIDEQIGMIERMLGGARSGAKPIVHAGSPGRRRRAMSAAARKRIADAQKKRWAEYRKKRTGKGA